MNKLDLGVYNTAMRVSILALLMSLFFIASNSIASLPVGSQGELETVQIDNETYIKSSALTKFLNGTEAIDFASKSGKSDFDGFSLEYSLFSPYIKSGDDIYNIYKPVVFRDGVFLLPMRYLVPVLNKVSSLEFSWTGKSLRVSEPEYNVTGVNAFQKINGLLIEIYMKDNLKFDALKTDDNWLAVTISNGKVDSLACSKPVSAKAVYDVKTYQFESSCQVSIRLRPRDFTFTSKVKEDPLRIQFLIRGDGFSDSAMIAGERTPEPFSENPIDIIVVDAGHGGEDNGAVGPTGLKEKDVVLKIAKHLFKLLKDDGRFKPVMTRQDDTFIPLSQRTAIANAVGGDLFVSIHANAAPNKKARGIIAFSLAPAKTDQARAAASLENSSIKFEKLSDQKQYATDLDFTLRDMMQSEFQRESLDFADMIHKKMSGATGLETRGVDQAGFFVLDKAYMPAILLETAFISNKTDEKLLKSDDFQKKTARSIYDSIVAFKEKYENQKRTSR